MNSSDNKKSSFDCLVCCLLVMVFISSGDGMIIRYRQ